jgi:hypothetical protein
MSDKPWRGTLLSHTHDSGRSCLLTPSPLGGDNDKVWMYWASDSQAWECGLTHPQGTQLEVIVPVSGAPIRCDCMEKGIGKPRYHELCPVHGAPEDREEFGMPTLGDQMGALIGELRAAPNPWSDEHDEPDSEPLITGGVAWDVEQDESRFWVMLNHAGMTVRYPSGKGNHTPAETPEAHAILEAVLPALLERFLMKNSKYALAQSGHDLGLKGIVPDINRKTSILIDRLWHGNHQHVDEGTVEVIHDLVGHCLLMLGKLAIKEEEDDGSR